MGHADPGRCCLRTNFSINTRAMNRYVSQVRLRSAGQLPRPPIVAPQQDSANAFARLSNSHRAKGDVDDGYRRVIFLMVWALATLSEGGVANLTGMFIGSFARLSPVRK